MKNNMDDSEEDVFNNNNNKPSNTAPLKNNISNTPPSINPVYSIAMFVIAFFAIVGGLIYYINIQRKSLPTSKPKKISKKKVI